MKSILNCICSLTSQVGELEIRIEELSRMCEEAQQQIKTGERQNERLKEQIVKLELTCPVDVRQDNDDEKHTNSNCAQSTEKEVYPVTSEQVLDCYYRRFGQNPTMEMSAFCEKVLSALSSSTEDSTEELANILQLVESSKKEALFENQRCSELEEQLAAMSKSNNPKFRNQSTRNTCTYNPMLFPYISLTFAVKENKSLEKRVTEIALGEDMRSMHGQGQLCCRCLRFIEDRATINNCHSLSLPATEDDIDTSSGCPNPFRDLVEKYEALLEVQGARYGGGMSLAEELLMSGDYMAQSPSPVMSEAQTTTSTSSESDSSEDKEATATVAAAGIGGGSDKDSNEETESILSSADSEQRSEENQENRPPVLTASTPKAEEAKDSGCGSMLESGRFLTPRKPEPLDGAGAISAAAKRKNRRKNRNSQPADRRESLLGLPRIYIGSGKNRREMRPSVDGNFANAEWNGRSLVIYNRKSSPANPANPDTVPYRPSIASQNFSKLKRLDLSYSEVLRRNFSGATSFQSTPCPGNDQQLRRRSFANNHPQQQQKQHS